MTIKSYIAVSEAEGFSSTSAKPEGLVLRTSASPSGRKVWNKLNPQPYPQLKLTPTQQRNFDVFYKEYSIMVGKEAKP